MSPCICYPHGNPACLPVPATQARARPVRGARTFFPFPRIAGAADGGAGAWLAVDALRHARVHHMNSWTEGNAASQFSRLTRFWRIFSRPSCSDSVCSAVQA